MQGQETYSCTSSYCSFCHAVDGKHCLKQVWGETHHATLLNELVSVWAEFIVMQMAECLVQHRHNFYIEEVLDQLAALHLHTSMKGKNLLLQTLGAQMTSRLPGKAAPQYSALACGHTARWAIWKYERHWLQ